MKIQSSKPFSKLFLNICVGLVLAVIFPNSRVEASDLERDCLKKGWKVEQVLIDQQERKLLWRGPIGPWTKGAIVVMHGGGGEAAHFCAGGWLVKPQIKFAEAAIERGFAVIALESTDNQVTDQQKNSCGKRFDFSVLERPNLDLPYIEKVITEVIPKYRPKDSKLNVYLTGLSTGGYMTIRAASSFPNLVTAFAPVAAGDPFGTDTNCDESLSRRKSAKGILKDRDTHKEIIEIGACAAQKFQNESPWPNLKVSKRPVVKQFHHQQDGIVDLSCMQRATTQLKLNAFPTEGVFLIEKFRRRSPMNHLWQTEYNEPILNFFESHQ